MLFYHSLPIPDLWEWNYPFLFPFPNAHKSFPLTPGLTLWTNTWCFTFSTWILSTYPTSAWIKCISHVPIIWWEQREYETSNISFRKYGDSQTNQPRRDNQRKSEKTASLWIKIQFPLFAAGYLSSEASPAPVLASDWLVGVRLCKRSPPIGRACHRCHGCHSLITSPYFFDSFYPSEWILASSNRLNMVLISYNLFHGMIHAN